MTPPLAAQAPEAAAAQAAKIDGPPLTRAELVEHVLSRVTFGARPQDRARVARIGVSAFLEEQLHPEQLDDKALEAKLARFDVLRRDSSSLMQELVEARRMHREKKADESPMTANEAAQHNLPPPPAPDDDMKPVRAPKDERRALGKAGRGPGFEFVSQLAAAKLVRAAESERQLREVMQDFWFNHFNVFAGKEVEAALLPEYDATIRAKALTTFPELLEAVAHSPAMLVYLDNWRSSTPDEPLRRRWVRPGRRVAFVAPKKPKGQRGINENYARELLELHTLGVDGGYTQKDIVEVARCFTGWTIDEPQRNPHFVFRPGMHDYGEKHVLGHTIEARGGASDGDDVLKILEDHPSTARFIATKLVRRFVSDDPPETLETRVAATYTRTRGDIRSMLRTIFEAPEFWSRKALKAKVRSPLELVAASVRALGASVDNPQMLAQAVARIGEPLYAAQAPTGYTDSAGTWLSPGALLSRIDFGLQLANGQIQGVNVDLRPLATADPEQLVQKASAQLGAGELSERTREHILDELRTAPPEVQPARAVGLLLGAPEVQRR